MNTDGSMATSPWDGPEVGEGPFAGKVALVTGAGSGIGAATAAHLHRMGATVVVNDVDVEAAQSVAGSLGGGRAVGLGGDVADPGAVAKVLVTTEERFHRLDIVVNNAGLCRDAAIHRMTDAEWDLVTDVCLRGVFNVCRASLGLLRRTSGAEHRKVVNVASTSGVYGVAGTVNYSAAKAGVIGVTRTLAREWARYRINVNAVAPGFVAGTGLTGAKEEGDLIGLDPDLLARIPGHIPLGRVGTPDDIAEVVAFLAGTGSDYVTGQVIEAHGGLDILPLPVVAPQ